MAATKKIAGDNTIIWGTPTTGITPSIGYLQSVKKKGNPEEAYVFDENGDTASYILFDFKGELTLEFVIKGTFTEPAEGDTCVALGKTGVISSVEDSRENKGPVKRTINAKFFANITPGA